MATIGEKRCLAIWREIEDDDDDATYAAIAIMFTDLLHTKHPQFGNVVVTTKVMTAWMKSMDVEEDKDAVKPYLTKSNMLQRVLHYTERLKLHRLVGTHDEVVEVHLDEKYFYFRTGREKRKRIPHRGGEAELRTTTRGRGQRNVGERRFRKTKHANKATSVMFLGVVGRPRPDKSFDGKVCLIRVSKKKIAVKNSWTVGLTSDFAVSQRVHDEWRSFVDPGMFCFSLSCMTEYSNNVML